MSAPRIPFKKHDYEACHSLDLGQMRAVLHFTSTLVYDRINSDYFFYFSGRRKRRINVGLLTWMTLAAVGGHYCHNYYRLTGIPCWVDDSPDSRGPVNKTRWGMGEGWSSVCCLEDEMFPHSSPPHVTSSLRHPPLKAVMFPSLSSSLPWFT